jgi:hypothetical protein
MSRLYVGVAARTCAGRANVRADATRSSAGTTRRRRLLTGVGVMRARSRLVAPVSWKQELPDMYSPPCWYSTRRWHSGDVLTGYVGGSLIHWLAAGPPWGDIADDGRSVTRQARSRAGRDWCSTGLSAPPSSIDLVIAASRSCLPCAAYNNHRNLVVQPLVVDRRVPGI